MLDQTVNEMQADLIKMRQASAQVLASQKQVEAKWKAAQGTADEWYKRAELAAGKGDDDLAREALTRRKAYQENADTMKTQLDAQRGAVAQLIQHQGPRDQAGGGQIQKGHAQGAGQVRGDVEAGVRDGAGPEHVQRGDGL
jgi:hypothetical protein